MSCPFDDAALPTCVGRGHQNSLDTQGFDDGVLVLVRSMAFASEHFLIEMFMLKTRRPLIPVPVAPSVPLTSIHPGCPPVGV